MGNLNCAVCKSTEEVINELQSNSSSLDNSSKYNVEITESYKETPLKINENKDNPFSAYSLALFQRFNLLRTEPLKFYSESNKYNLSNILEELINSNDNTLGLTWSTKKEKIINNIMKNEKIPDIRSKLFQIKKIFSKEYDIKVYYAKGQFSRIDDALWNVLNGLKNISEDKLRKLLLNKIDYCVIYSLSEDQLKIDNDNDSNTDESGGNHSNNGVVSFFIFFNTKSKSS